jgi:hypothetical protein
MRNSVVTAPISSGLWASENRTTGIGPNGPKAARASAALIRGETSTASRPRPGGMKPSWEMRLNESRSM